MTAFTSAFPAYAVTAVFGAVLGSFVGTAAWRVAVDEPWAFGRSTCDACSRALPYSQSIPIASYLGLRGRCASCHAIISPLHTIAEAAGALVVVCALAWFTPIEAAAVGALGFLLIFISVFDARTQRIPDWCSLTAFALCELLASRAGRGFEGALTGCGVFVALYLVRAVHAHRRGEVGLGLGDVKLFAALSVWLGLHKAPLALAVSAALALAYIAGLSLTTRTSTAWRGRLAFGPFLAVGCWSAGALGGGV